MDANYLLGHGEKMQKMDELGQEEKRAQSPELGRNGSRELIDIVFVDDESERKSELSKITEVECSHKQFSQEKLTNSFLNSNFENDKTNEHMNRTSKKSSVEVAPCSLFRKSTQFLQASSKSINLTKSNNISVIENLNYSLDEKQPNSPVAVKRVARIKLKPIDHKSKSRSLDIQCLNHLRTSHEEELAKYRKYKTLLSNIKNAPVTPKGEEVSSKLSGRNK